MLTPLLPVSHRQQQEQADCLAACAAMVIDYLQIRLPYTRLHRLLNVQEHGAFFSDLENLRALGLAVRVGEGDLATILDSLDSGLPAIVAVQTGYLVSYWQDAVGHALVVIGVEGETIYVHDPALDTGARAINMTKFLTAWGERDFLYAVIGLE